MADDHECGACALSTSPAECATGVRKCQHGNQMVPYRGVDSPCNIGKFEPLRPEQPHKERA